MTYQRRELHAALRTLMRAALEDLTRHDDAPVIGPLPDLRHWQRHSQTSFVALRRAAWHMPERVATVDWLETFPEMAVARKVVNADPIIASRVDTVVGTEFAKQYRRFNWMLIEDLLEPIVMATCTFQFDAVAFESAYARLEAGLLATEIRMVEFLPLNAFISGSGEIRLLGGLTLRPMTDRQLSAAIRVQGVPGEFGGGPTAFEVSWLNQWALVVERSFPVRSDKEIAPSEPIAAPFPTLLEPASRLVQALRIVCGGSVIATRPIHIQHDQDFPADLGASAMLPPIGLADLSRPTRLDSQDVDDVCEVFRLLADPVVQGNRAIQTALRRLVASGSRSLAQDRLVDLMTSAEALFIKLAGIRSRDKGKLIAEGARVLLTSDSVLASDARRITEFMTLAYQLRNDEIHGDDPTRHPATLLDGTEAGGLATFVEDIERVMRRAIHLTLRDPSYSATSS